MSARVFISYRTSDGADKATALARDLDELFGQEQIFLDKDDLPAGSRWRDEIAHALGSAPILLVLVTPNYLGARDPSGVRCIERDDDAVRAELTSAMAAGAHIIPMLCDGVMQTPAAAELPAPFDQLAHLTWRRLRAYDWREDLARLSNDLRSLGVVPRTTPGALGPAPLGIAGSGHQVGGQGAASAGGLSSTGRRLALAAAGVVLAGAGFALWQWQEKKAASLAGRWRAHIGKRGASTSRDGEIVNVTIEQAGRKLRVTSSAVDIERDPEWQKYRELWQQRFGQPLNRVFYRGEGDVLQDESAPSDAPDGPRRVLLSVRVDPPEGGEPIATGALSGAIDPDGTRIRCKLRLSSEQAERVVDLRRAP